MWLAAKGVPEKGWLAKRFQIQKKNLDSATREGIVFLFLKTFVELASIESGLPAGIAEADGGGWAAFDQKEFPWTAFQGMPQPVAGRAECLTRKGEHDAEVNLQERGGAV